MARKGREKPGILDKDGKIRDLSAHVPDIAGTALLPDTLKKLAALDPAELPLASGGLRIGPCVGKVGKFICIGLNYADHAAETGAADPARADHLHEGDQRHHAARTTRSRSRAARRRPTGKSSSAS